MTGTANIAIVGATAATVGHVAGTTNTSSTTGLTNTNVSGFAAAQTAITLIDDALATVNNASQAWVLCSLA